MTLSAPHTSIVVKPRPRGYSVRRYYDPQTGQFISVDPAVDQTEAPYGYVNGDPVDNTDPLGLDICLFGHCAPTPSLQHVSDAVAGFGDMITFGGTAWVRGQINSAFGLPNSVDYCSSWYSGGEYAGFDTTLFLGGYGLLGDAAEGGNLLARIRSIDWADETGSIGGSTGRTVAQNLKEQLAMEQAVSDPGAGIRVPIKMSDPRWGASDGWVKMAQNVNGVEIHYVLNTITGAVDDFKFVGGVG